MRINLPNPNIFKMLLVILITAVASGGGNLNALAQSSDSLERERNRVEAQLKRNQDMLEAHRNVMSFDDPRHQWMAGVASFLLGRSGSEVLNSLGSGIDAVQQAKALTDPTDPFENTFESIGYALSLPIPEPTYQAAGELWSLGQITKALVDDAMLTFVKPVICKAAVSYYQTRLDELNQAQANDPDALNSLWNKTREFANKWFSSDSKDSQPVDDPGKQQRQKALKEKQERERRQAKEEQARKDKAAKEAAEREAKTLSTEEKPSVQQPSEIIRPYDRLDSTNVIKRPGFDPEPDTKPQVGPWDEIGNTSQNNDMSSRQTSQPNSAGGKDGDLLKMGWTPEQIARMTPGERSLARKRIIHPGKYY